jgi:Phage tail protein
MTAHVQIGSLTFYGDDLDAEWIYSAVPGWYSGAPLRGGTEDFPNGDGGSPIEQVYRSARTFRFEGALKASTVEEALALWEEFASLQSSGEPIPFTVTDPRGSRTAMVSLNGAPELREISNTAATVAAPFIAYDPVKYGPARTISGGLPTAGGGLAYPLSGAGVLDYGANGDLGRVTLSNVGTARVWPFLTVQGGLTAGFFVQRLDTGQVVRYDRVVPAGSSVSIDFRTGEVLIDGVSDGSTYLTRYEFFSVEPGASIEVQFNAIAGSTGLPSARFDWADGYW